MLGEGLGHPEVAEDVGGPLHLDPFRGLEAGARGDRGVVDEDVKGSARAAGEGVDFGFA